MKRLSAYLVPVFSSVVIFVFFSLLLTMLKAGPVMALLMVVALTLIDVFFSRRKRSR